MASVSFFTSVPAFVDAAAAAVEAAGSVCVTCGAVEAAGTPAVMTGIFSVVSETGVCVDATGGDVSEGFGSEVVSKLVGGIVGLAWVKVQKGPVRVSSSSSVIFIMVSVGHYSPSQTSAISQAPKAVSRGCG